MTCDWLLKYTAGLCGGLSEAGADVSLFTRDHALEFGGELAEMSSHVRSLAPDVALSTLPGRMRDVGALPTIAALRRERRRSAPDVVHFQEAVENDPRLVLISGLRRGRFAYTVHDPVLHPGDSRPARHAQWLRRWLLRHAGLVFVHAESLREELERTEDVGGPIEVVPHGMTVAPVAALPERQTILMFGRLSEYKGIDVMLEAMQQIWQRFPATRLVVAGEGDLPAYPGFEDERVDFRPGHVREADIPALFADATLVALPYIQASQSGVGSLAKSHGRATVVTSVGGLPELVSDDSGLVIPPRNHAALADAVISLLDDPGRTMEMGLNGSRSAEESAGWHTVGEATLAAYERHGLL